MRIGTPLPAILHLHKIKLPSLFDVPLFKPENDEIDPEENTNDQQVDCMSIKNNVSLSSVIQIQIAYAVTSLQQSENFIPNCIDSISANQESQNKLTTDYFKKG